MSNKSDPISGADKAFIIILLVLCVLAPISCAVSRSISPVSPEECKRMCNDNIKRISSTMCECGESD